MTKNDIEIIQVAFEVSPDVVASWYYGACPMSDYNDEKDCFEDDHIYVDNCDEIMNDAHPVFELIKTANDYFPTQGDYALHYIIDDTICTPHGGRSLQNFADDAMQLIENARSIVHASHK